MVNDKFLEGKVALITGAGGGFGREMAYVFASRGANLVINDINMAGLEETREIILKDKVGEILKEWRHLPSLADLLEATSKYN